MKKILNIPMLAIIAIAFIFTACDEGDEITPNTPPSLEEYPSLMVVNESTENSLITSVSLVGYTLGSLSIEPGSSQTFVLDKGMSGGYEDININVRFRAQNTSYGTESISVSFSEGKTKTIKLKGCHGANACTGFYLE